MKTRITIGRHPDNDIVVAPMFDTVSGHHATITRSGDNYVFEDHSTNGSYINNDRIHNVTTRIYRGDNIKLSSSYTLDWRQIDNLMGCGNETVDNRATQYRPQAAAFSNVPKAESYSPVREPAPVNNVNVGQAQDKPNQPMQESPKCLDSFNWGAFFLSGLWGLFNSYGWLFLVMFVPLANVIAMFAFGISGNKWAWEKEKNSISAKEFDEKQHRWNVAAGVILALNVLLFILGSMA